MEAADPTIRAGHHRLHLSLAPEPITVEADPVVELHGGRIDAASEGRGKGSRFTGRLPLAAPAATVRGAPLASIRSEMKPPAAS